jgi:hypothetical protein
MKKIMAVQHTCIDGGIPVAPGDVCDVTNETANLLIGYGFARLATPEDMQKLSPVPIVIPSIPGEDEDDDDDDDEPK